MSDGQTGPRPPEAGGPHLEQGVGSQGRCGWREILQETLDHRAGGEVSRDRGAPRLGDPRPSAPLASRLPAPSCRQAPGATPAHPHPPSPPADPHPDSALAAVCPPLGLAVGLLTPHKERLPQPPWTLHAAKLPGSLPVPRGAASAGRPSPVHLLNRHTETHPKPFDTSWAGPCGFPTLVSQRPGLCQCRVTCPGLSPQQRAQGLWGVPVPGLSLGGCRPPGAPAVRVTRKRSLQGQRMGVRRLPRRVTAAGRLHEAAALSPLWRPGLSRL